MKGISNRDLCLPARLLFLPLYLTHIHLQSATMELQSKPKPELAFTYCCTIIAIDEIIKAVVANMEIGFVIVLIVIVIIVLLYMYINRNRLMTRLESYEKALHLVSNNVQSDKVKAPLLI